MSPTPISVPMTAPIEHAIRTRWARPDRRIRQRAAELLLEVGVLGVVTLVAVELLERVAVALVQQEQLAVRRRPDR